MIVAAGLSPAWQQILEFDRLQIGSVNRARAAHWCGSGKVLNVGMALAHLGARQCTIAPLGGPALAAIEKEFGALGIEGRWIATASATRVCTTLLDEATGTTTELVENAQPISSSELEAFAQAFRQASTEAAAVVLTGSMPSAAPVELFRDLLRTTQAPAVLDLRGPELLVALEAAPLVIKPNRDELAATLGHPIDTDDELAEAVRQLQERGAQWVVVSAGREPLWIFSPEQVFRCRPPRLQRVVNPIGCGDCLAAGIAVGIARGDSVVEATRLGIAAAADNAGQLLPARVDLSRVTAMMSNVQIDRAT